MAREGQWFWLKPTRRGPIASELGRSMDGHVGQGGEPGPSAPTPSLGRTGTTGQGAANLPHFPGHVCHTWNEMRKDPSKRLQMKTVSALNLDGLGDISKFRHVRGAKRAPSPKTLRTWAREMRGTLVGEQDDQPREELEGEDEDVVPYTRTLIWIPCRVPNQGGGGSTGSGAGAEVKANADIVGVHQGGGSDTYP